MADAPTPPQLPPTTNTFGQDSSEPWALEDTLKKVLDVLQKELSLGNKQGRSFDQLNKNVAKLINSSNNRTNTAEDRDRHQSTKMLGDIQKIAKRELKIQEEQRKHQKYSASQARADLAGVPPGRGKKPPTLFDKTWNSLGESSSKLGKALFQSGDDINTASKGILGAIPIVGGLLASSIGMVNKAQEQIAGMAKYGQSFNSSMVGFANSAASAGLSMGQAAQIISDNHETVAKIGAVDFLKLQRRVRATTEQFGRFGLSVEDQAKVTSAFYETQMNLNKRSNATNARAIADYTAKLSVLSELTGKSIDQLAEEQKQISKNPDVWAAAESVFERSGKAAADNFQKVTSESASIMPDSMKDLSTQMLSDYGKYGTIATSDLGRAMISAGQGGIVDKLDAAIKTGDTRKYAAAMLEFAKNTQTLGGDQRRVFANIIRSGGPVADAFKKVAEGTIDVSKLNPKLVEQTLDNLAEEKKKKSLNTDLDKAIQKQTEMQKQLSEAHAKMLQASTYVYPSLMKIAIAATNLVTKIFENKSFQAAFTHFADVISLIADVIAGPVGTVLTSLIDKLGWVLEKFMDLGKWVADFFGATGDHGKPTNGEKQGQAVGAMAGIGTIYGAWRLGKAGIKKLGGRLFGTSEGGAAAAEGGAAAAEGGAATAAEGGAATAAGGLGAAGMATIGAGLAGGLAVGYIGNVVADKLKENGHETAGKVTSVGSDVAGGALAGAAIGSVVPILGTAIGAGLGGLLGGAYGMYKNYGAGAPPEHPAAQHQPNAKPKPDQNQQSPEMVKLKSLYDYKMQLEKIFFNYQLSLGKIRHNYEMSLLNQRYGIHNANNNKQHKQTTAQADASFRTQVDQAKRVRTSMDQYQDKAAKMGSLNQTGIIVQPMIGDDVGSQQLQEMKLTNQFLYNIYDIQRGTRKFKPLVEIYQPGL